MSDTARLLIKGAYEMIDYERQPSAFRRIGRCQNGATSPCNPAPGEQMQHLAFATVAPQAWRNLYNPEDALMRGTIFTELDLPFLGGTRQQRYGGNCRA